MTTRTRLLSAAVGALFVLSAACGESSPPATAKPAAPPSAPAPAPSKPAPAPAKPAAPNPLNEEVAKVQAGVQSSLDSLKAEAAKADKSTLETVIADTKTAIADKEKAMSDVQAQIKAKTAEMAQSLLGKSTDSLKAEVDSLTAQLDVLKKELAGLNEKLQIYVAELAQRPA